MNKSELIKAVAKKTSLGESQVRSAVDGALNEIVATVRAGRDVRITDFGTFKKKTLAARSGKSPSTGEPYSVPARDVLGFKAASNVVA